MGLCEAYALNDCRHARSKVQIDAAAHTLQCDNSLTLRGLNIDHCQIERIFLPDDTLRTNSLVISFFPGLRQEMSLPYDRARDRSDLLQSSCRARRGSFDRRRFRPPIVARRGQAQP